MEQNRFAKMARAILPTALLVVSAFWLRDYCQVAAEFEAIPFRWAVDPPPIQLGPMVR
jgi:hypothetical protein